MKKHLLKRSLAMLLAVLTVMATVPLMAVPAFAASGTLSFDDSNIGLKYTTANATTLTSTYGTWSASGTTIEGNAKASNFSAKSGSLTITNNYATKMLISFSYACTATSSSTTIKIDGNSITGSGSFSKEVDAAGTIKIEISAAKKEEGTIKITDFLALDPNKEVTLTFQAPKNGSYSVNGATISNETSVTNLATELWTLKASPASGYKFICWYDVTDEKVLSTDLEYSNYFDSNRTIVAKFASTAAAVFMVEEQIFGDLGDAVTYAQNNSKTLIKLASNGTVTGQYTIPAGITLLIPFDDDYTLYTTKPGYVESNVTPVAYRTMTMATGSSITVNGSISVGGKHYTSTSQTACKPTGPYGHIKMEADSNIVLNNGANLYAWGYITGNGSITANSGATVYEYFQIVDWRGGGKTSEMAGNEQKVFPFTQYYVQNIEASLTLKQGANEYVYITLTVSGQHADATVNFIGDNGLFALGSDGSITKKYDATQSKLKIDISGTASLNSIALSATILLQKIDVDSSDYVLPINGNIDITVKSGTTTITKDVALLPGVVATIEEGAELKVASGATLYVYEAGTWATNFTWGTNTLPYSPTNTNRINYTIKGVSAKLDVNGTLTSDGDIYTTACEDENEGIIASNICSSKGTGVFVKNAETEVEGITYQVIQTSNGLAYEEIPVLCAWLRNADGSYTDSFEAEVGTKIYYTQGTWTIPESEVTVTFKPNGGSGSDTTQTVTNGVATALDANTFTRTGYTFVGWNTEADGTGTLYNDKETLTLSSDITLYAQWEKITYTVIWQNDDGSELYRATFKYGEQEPTYNGTTPTAANTTEGYSYEFIFWQYDEENSSANDYISIFIAQFKSLREKWHTDDNGTSYYEADEKKYVSSWAGIDGAYYYFDDEGYIVKDYNRLPYPTELLPQYAPDEEDSRVNKKDQPGYLEEVGEYPDDDSAIFYFGDDGKFKIDYCGTYDDNGVTRFIDHGMLIWHAGLVELDGDYYYFKRTGMVKNGEYYVADTNGLLKTAKYNFASDGKLIKLEGIRKDPFNSSILRYYRNYSAVYYAGLIEVDGDYYYVNEACEAVKDGAYLVKKTNGLLNGNDNGFYMFDEDGKVCKDRNGLMVDYEESGQYLYYYVQGERVYAGLVEGYGGYYYYIKSDLTAARNGEFWVTKVNDTGIKAGYKRTFNDEGCMVMKNGVELYDAGKNIYVYYENDDMVIAPEGETVERVLDDGRKINIDEYGVVTFLSEQNGLVFEDNGDICYYENGVKVTNKGLVQDDDGNFYYINWTGKAVKNGQYWVTIVNDTGVKAGLLRTFDADGKMVVKNGLEIYEHKTAKDGYEYDVYVYYKNDDIQISMDEIQLPDGRTIWTDEYGVVHFKED